MINFFHDVLADDEAELLYIKYKPCISVGLAFNSDI
jgi:hypothetical protein